MFKCKNKSKKRRPRKFRWWHYALILLIVVGVILIAIAGSKGGKSVKNTKQNVHGAGYVIVGGTTMLIDEINYQKHNP